VHVDDHEIIGDPFDLCHVSYGSSPSRAQES